MLNVLSKLAVNLFVWWSIRSKDEVWLDSESKIYSHSQQKFVYRKFKDI